MGYSNFNMKITQNVLTFVFFLMTCLSFSQGKVTGTIIDNEFNEPMAFANVVVKGTSMGVSADFDGKYELELEEGTYTLVFSFVGYTTKEITDVIVKSGGVVTLDVLLETNSLDTVVITTSTKRNTESAVLNLQKNDPQHLRKICNYQSFDPGCYNHPEREHQNEAPFLPPLFSDLQFHQ